MQKNRGLSKWKSPCFYELSNAKFTAIYSAIDDNGLIGTYPERANPEANYTSLIPLHTGVYAPHDSDFEYIYEANCRELRIR